MVRTVRIGECWERIKPGLEIIRVKTHADWGLDDAYQQCLLDQWAIFMDDAVDGFLITRLYQCEFTGVRRLEVIAAYYGGSDVDPTEMYLPFIQQLARAADAKQIEVRSPRRGWERKGFRVVDITYRMEVEDELAG